MLRRDHRILKSPDADGEGGGGSGGVTDTPQKAERPADLPETFWDAEKGEVKFADLGKKLTEYETQLGALPKGVEKPEEIDFSLPADLDPDNADAVYEVNRDDPMVQAITPALVGLPQERISGLIGAFAKFQLSQDKQVREAIAAEEKKLGEKFMDRVSGAQAFIEQVASKSGKSAADAKAIATRMRQTWVTAEQVELIEMIQKFAGGPAPAPSDSQKVEETDKGRTFYAGMAGAGN